MSDLRVIFVPQLSDNYAYLVVDNAAKEAAIVDCPEATSMIEMIERQGVEPVAIFNTHHHWDHVGGNADLMARWPRMRIYGHHSDKDRIPGITDPIDEGSRIKIGHHTADVLHIPGHTHGHVAYHFADAHLLFCGDTLFSVGCGRIFEGTPAQMFASLQKIAHLPDETLIYCGHEYTASNLRFALSIDPNNADLHKREREVHAKRSENQPTLPVSLASERKTNPFLRTDAIEIQQAAAHEHVDPSDRVAVFAAIRRMKDHF